MTLAEAAKDTRDVATVPTAELKDMLNAFVAAKCWGSSRFYAVDREVQNRATRQWVIEDVFGPQITGIF